MLVQFLQSLSEALLFIWCCFFLKDFFGNYDRGDSGDQTWLQFLEL